MHVVRWCKAHVKAGSGRVQTHTDQEDEMRKWHTAGTGWTTTMTPAEHKEKSKEWTDSKTEGFFSSEYQHSICKVNKKACCLPRCTIWHGRARQRRQIYLDILKKKKFQGSNRHYFWFRLPFICCCKSDTLSIAAHKICDQMKKERKPWFLTPHAKYKQQSRFFFPQILEL